MKDSYPWSSIADVSASGKPSQMANGIKYPLSRCQMASEAPETQDVIAMTTTGPWAPDWTRTKPPFKRLSHDFN